MSVFVCSDFVLGKFRGSSSLLVYDLHRVFAFGGVFCLLGLQIDLGPILCVAQTKEGQHPEVP